MVKDRRNQSTLELRYGASESCIYWNCGNQWEGVDQKGIRPSEQNWLQ